MKCMWKKKSLLLIVAALMLVLVACGTEDDSSSSATDGDSGIEKILVGTEATFAPFESMNDKGEIVGIDVDILNAIGEEMNLEVEIRNVGWEPVFQQLKNGELDLGASGITITEERKETYDFSTPYYEATQLIVVKEDSAIKSLQELEDKKISVQINTTGHIAARKLQGETSADIRAFENLPTAIQEMINGGTEAAIGDNAVILEYLKNNPNAKLKTIESADFEKEFYGFMVKKGNEELLNIINEGIEKIKANGKLKEITGQEI